MQLKAKDQKRGAQSTVKPDAATMRTLIATVLAITVAVLLQSANHPPDKATNNQQHQTLAGIFKPGHEANDGLLEVGRSQPDTGKPVPPQVTKPKPKPPAAWKIAASPHGGIATATINRALAHYQKMGMSKQGAAYLVGNFIAESGLVPCGAKGDGGLAWGFGQWHPGRRQDMPCGFYDQLTWAVDVEMRRDTPELRVALFDKNTSVATIQALIYKWERWGTLGARWQYAASIHQQI